MSQKRAASTSIDELSTSSFTVSQLAPGMPLQFQPPMDSLELDILIDTFISGPGALSQKKAAVTIDFLKTAGMSEMPFPVSRTYYVTVPSWQAPAMPAQDMRTSPVALTPVSTPSSASSSAGAVKRPRKASSPSSSNGNGNATAKRLPGFSIMTKDGLDITDYASRGPKTEMQRREAAMMRKLGSCPACKRSKQKCDPSHPRSATASKLTSAVAAAAAAAAMSSNTSSTASSGSRASISPPTIINESFSSHNVARKSPTGLVAHAGQNFSPFATPKPSLSPSDFVADKFPAPPPLDISYGAASNPWDASLYEFTAPAPENYWPLFDPMLEAAINEAAVFPQAQWSTGVAQLPSSSFEPRAATSPSQEPARQDVVDLMECQPGTRDSTQSTADPPPFDFDLNFDDWIDASALHSLASPRREVNGRGSSHIHFVGASRSGSFAAELRNGREALDFSVDEFLSFSEYGSSTSSPQSDTNVTLLLPLLNVKVGEDEYSNSVGGKNGTTVKGKNGTARARQRNAQGLSLVIPDVTADGKSELIPHGPPGGRHQPDPSAPPHDLSEGNTEHFVRTTLSYSWTSHNDIVIPSSTRRGLLAEQSLQDHSSRNGTALMTTVGEESVSVIANCVQRDSNNDSQALRTIVAATCLNDTSGHDPGITVIANYNDVDLSPVSNSPWTSVPVSSWVVGLYLWFCCYSSVTLASELVSPFSLMIFVLICTFAFQPLAGLDISSVLLSSVLSKLRTSKREKSRVPFAPSAFESHWFANNMSRFSSFLSLAPRAKHDGLSGAFCSFFHSSLVI